MTELLTAAQMRALEQAAIASKEVTGLELMERAGAGVVAAVIGQWPELAKGAHRAVVLCGPGNNGGDGFVIARLLQARGWAVEVLLYGDPLKLPPDAKTNLDRWQQVGPVLALAGVGDVTSDAPDLIVDAIFGTGLKRPIADLSELFSNLNNDTAQARSRSRANCRLTSVDMPSGLCSDSGRTIGQLRGADGDPQPGPSHVESQITVTFHSMKPGHVLADGPDICGKIVVKDIGLGASPLGSGEVARLVKAPVGADLYKRRGHKFAHGHALVLSGGFGRTGAARLAARGALRIGAGLVTLGVPGAAQIEVASQITALMMRRVDDSAALADALGDSRISALCLGPGLGLERSRDLVPVALQAPHRPGVVLDADALSAFADAPDRVFDMLHPGCVLTPHGGEFARLFPDIAKRLSQAPMRGPAYSKVDAVREAAARAGCVVLFKGPDTVIADPSGACLIHAAAYDRAAPWLATAGSGDVLAGFICGLLARGLAPLQAAETAAWLHVECARAFGPGLIAEDLPDQLPLVLQNAAL